MPKQRQWNIGFLLSATQLHKKEASPAGNAFFICVDKNKSEPSPIGAKSGFIWWR